LRDLIHEYGYKGWYNVEYNINLDTAEYYLKKALDLQYANYIVLDDRVATNHVSLASVYRRLYNNSEALKHLNRAEEILNRYDPNSYLFGNIYNNKGNIISTTNDVYRTKEYYEYALDFLSDHGYQNTTNFSHIFSNYIKLLFELEEFELAEQQLAMININTLNLNQNTEFRFHIINATTYSKLGRYELAIAHYDDAFKILNEQNINEYSNNAITYYYHTIDFYILYEEYDKALEQCSEALSFIESLDPHSTKNKTIYQTNTLYRVATIQHRKNNYERANEIVNRAIRNLNDFFKLLSYPDPGENAAIRNEYASVLPELYILRSRILFDQYKISTLLDDLTASYSSYQTAIATLNSLKLSMQNENSKIFATSVVLEVYNEAIYIAKLLYEKTGDMDYLEKSFEFAESSKSFALFSEIKNMEAIEFSDLPHEVKVKEQSLIGEIQGYEEMLFEEQLSPEPDSILVAFYKDKIFHLKDDYNDLLQEIEQNYANYFELKYNPEFISLKELQKRLPYNDALIEYVLNDTLLITYVIDRKGINVFSQEVDPDFSDECIEYYRILYRQNFSNGVHDNYRRFVTLGRKFYRILVEPCLQYTDRKNLTIVPDGAITYLPFEGFITHDVDTEYINYLVLPYLIRDFSLGYSHSSTLLFAERLKTKSPENKVLAFAPKYINPLDQIDSSWNRQADPDFLLPLPGILKEVQSIDETVPSRIFLNEQATEANFKKYAPDYNVLHLAMHTIMDDEQPLQSLLAFSNVEDSDSVEDNRLYAYEIYNMKLNAQMAVLSSCSSGFGKMQKGEGMMSLARGFIYAGCPCIVMTLWQVSDKSSSELMTSFYRYLKKGRSKQEAMRLAKIDYLDDADDLTSNPYFWSGFVVVGDGSPVYRKSGLTYWLLVVAVFAGALLLLQYRRGIKK